MVRDFKCTRLSTVLLVLALALHNSHSATLTDILLSDESNKPQEISSDEFIPPPRLSRDVKYPRYASDNTDKNLKPEDSPDRDRDRDTANSPPGKRCISCFASYPSYSNTPSSYDRPRYSYDDRSRDRDYDRYDDRDRYYDRDRYDRYNDRDRYYRGRDRYGDRDRYYDPYDNDRYDPYERYDRYGDRSYDRYDRDRYDRYSDRGIGYDNKGYDYRINDPYKNTYDEYNRGYAGRPDYGTSGYASKWNYGNSGSGRDDYYSRDRYPSYRPVSKDTSYNRDPYNDTYRPTSYLYGRPSSTTPKPPTGDSNTQSPQGNSG